jgi:phosphoglycerate kinase
MKREIDALSVALENPPRPYVALLGGAKADDSLRVAINLLERNIVDTVAFLGVVGNFMLMSDGLDIGNSNADFARSQVEPFVDETSKMASHILSNYRDKVILPEDLAIELNGSREPLSIQQLPTPHPIYDVGISTLMRLRPIVMGASCVLWNGPASYFEKENFAFGTIEVLNMCVETNAMTIIGGGHTSALVEARGVSERVTHNSSGGGATLTMLSGGRMPVIDALKHSSEISESMLEERGLLR